MVPVSSHVLHPHTLTKAFSLKDGPDQPIPVTKSSALSPQVHGFPVFCDPRVEIRAASMVVVSADLGLCETPAVLQRMTGTLVTQTWLYNRRLKKMSYSTNLNGTG